MELDRRTILQMPLLAGAAAQVFRQSLEAAGRKLAPQPNRGLLRFGVMGDGGSGADAQMRVAARMRAWRRSNP